MGHVMDVITCITWWSLPLQSHYIQDVIHVITCPLHAPKDANDPAAQAPADVAALPLLRQSCRARSHSEVRPVIWNPDHMT